MTVVLFIVGFSIDLIVASMTGTTFYFLWDWLIIPTFEVMALSWTAAVVAAFTVKFLTRPAADVFDIDVDDLWPFMGRVLWNNIAHCISFLILGFLLTFII